MKKIVMLVLFILFIPLMSFAQNLEGVNGRTDAMGGVYQANDMGWIVGSPSLMANFPDMLHGSIFAGTVPNLGQGDDIGQTYGNITLTKSLGAAVCLGLTFNERYYMPKQFFEDGIKFLQYKDYLKASMGSMKMTPSLALGFKFGENFNFGVSGFYASYQYTGLADSTMTYVAQNGTDSVSAAAKIDETDKRIRVFGVVVDAMIKAGNLTIRPMVQFGMPSINGKRTNDALDVLKGSLSSKPAADPQSEQTLNENIEWSSPNTSLLKGGCYFSVDTDNFGLNTGASFQSRSYQFKQKFSIDSAVLDASGGGTVGTSSGEVLTSQRSTMGGDFFFNLVSKFSDDFVFIPEYDGAFGKINGKHPDIALDTNITYMYHNIRFGFEKIIPDFWIFDNLYLRGGVLAYWSKTWQTVTDENTGKVTNEEDFPWSYDFFWAPEVSGKKQAKVSGGIGLKKGRGQLDISGNLLGWKDEGLMSGPPAAIITLTVDFGRDKDF